MASEQEIEGKFWRALKSDRTLMLGIHGAEDGHTRPMTAQTEQDEGGPIWFFTAAGADLVEAAATPVRAVAAFASKGHEVFAAIHGSLVEDTDRAVVDRLWNRFVAAWYPGGKDDPTLRLLRLDPDRAEIWLDEHHLVAGIKLLLGRDPKQDYAGKVAKVELG